MFDKESAGVAALNHLLGSSLRRGINPHAYLHWLFSKLPFATNRTVHTLTPAAGTAHTGSKDQKEAVKADC